MSEHEEPEQAPPWRPEHGEAPTVWSWPAGDRPALRVLIDGQWVYTPVRARHTWPDVRCAYHVDLVLPGETSAVHRAYWWPQEGRLRVWSPPRAACRSRATRLPERTQVGARDSTAVLDAWPMTT
ncbi:hypothetical protein [Streptomyces noursei]|uniref:hypothetical protein n=1 Tax=Streptomyces noursei TaxID=1971 RepID=UPI001671F5C5|nr:hypothetical protein [Streptomyces noursei]MCZ1021075.1 hypothetical protein [Streptomyces noursei]GGX55600.1 hypothetical protein GCM10010341_90510 [Streptomyces noursei]